MTPNADAEKDRSHRTPTPRLAQDRFVLYPWAANSVDARRIGRRASDRATVEDNPSDSPGDQTTLAGAT